MIGKKIPVVFRIMFVIWVILQVCLVIKYWDMPNHDDAQAYVKLASEASRGALGIRTCITNMRILFSVRGM